MDLKEFVAETLVQIIEGVKDAQTRGAEHGAEINPNVYQSPEAQKKHLFSRSGLTQMVEFDVALTAMEGTATKGGIGVALGVVALGSGGQSQAEKSSVSRVKFEVPMTLPILKTK